MKTLPAGRSQKLIVGAAALALLCAVLPGSARATTVVHLPLAKLTREAHVIVEATVERTTCRKVEQRLFTYVTVRVKAWHKGPPKRPRTLLLRIPGGRLGQDWLTVVGMPRFAVGERVLLFLQRQPGFYWPLGLQQGKFRLTTDTAGRKMAARNFRGLEFLGVSGTPPRTVPLTRLLELVRRALKKSPGRRP